MATALVLLLLVAAVALFASERLPVDLITLLLLSVLLACGIITPKEAFAGFSSDIIIILGAIFVIGGALQKSGLLEAGASRLLRFSSAGVGRLTLLLMGVSAGFSSFMNNTTVTAMLVAPASGLARSAGVSPSRLLMPLAFAAIMGGTCTLIGTSTNVAVSGYLASTGVEPVGMFEITPIGLVVVVVGIGYFMLLGRRLLPDVPGETGVPAGAIRDYLCEVVILPNSPLVGQPAFDWELNLVGFRLVRIRRGGSEAMPSPDLRLEAGDVLMVRGRVEDLLRVRKIEGLDFVAEVDPSKVAKPSDHLRVAEVVLLPGCDLLGMSLRETNLRRSRDLMVIAVSRRGRSKLTEMSRLRMRAGDVLLVQGPAERIEALGGENGFAVLGAYEPPALRVRQGAIAASLFVAAVVLGATGVLPLSAALLFAAVLTMLAGCISADEARELIDWRLLILIGGMTAFGTAMEKSGAADQLAGWMVGGLSPLGPMAVLGGFFVLTIVLTQPMSNAAAALVVLPVAMSAAGEIGANPRTFAIAIMIAASISFIAPLEPSCVIVYGPGRYRFRDFLRVGGGLTLVLAAVVLPLITVLWPLE